jgi:GT2 family glycosyltransferase
VAPATDPISVVRAVVVDHDGGELTLRCLERLVAVGGGARDLQVVLVDNASRRPVVDEVRRRFPTVDVRRSSENHGFGGGCNLALGDLDGLDAVALVNSDVEVSDGWLEPLAAALDADPALGAASPKMLLADRFLDVRLEVAVRRRRRGDRRLLGVRYLGAEGSSGVRCRPHAVEGFHDVEPGARGTWFRWTTERAHLRVPVRDEVPPQIRLHLDADEPTPVVALVGGIRSDLVVGPLPAWHEVAADGPVVAVVNNAGVVLDDDGFGADRGYLSPDDGSWDSPSPIEAWSGGAVLLRGDALRQLQGFQASLFLYYEDVELSLRATRAGWRHVYVPASVVHHAHAGSVGADSDFAERLKDRNRLVVSVRHAPLGVVPGRVWRFVRATASYVVRDIVINVINGERPRAAVVARRVRALAGALRMAPAAAVARRRLTP